MIEVNNLVKKYGGHTAVDHLSFRVEEGQIYGFLGPNGAGKSTTMNIITGYLASTEGSVVINGHDILEEPEEAKKCIGYLPEMPPLYFDMTVKEYLGFAAELKKIPKKERAGQIAEVMEMTKISDMENRLIKNLSKGYRQRVGLAQAILGYPEIIILDEPTVGLDPKQIIEIRDLIKNLSKKHTVILSSHILSEVSAVCDYVLIIAHGKLVASDTPENLAKLMEGENTLELTVKGGKDRVKEVLNTVPAIRECSLKKSEEEGAVDAVIHTQGETDAREELFYALAANECPILRMQSVHVSLEDIFLELTSDENVQGTSGKKRRKFAKFIRKDEAESFREDGGESPLENGGGETFRELSEDDAGEGLEVSAWDAQESSGAAGSAWDTEETSGAAGGARDAEGISGVVQGAWQADGTGQQPAAEEREKEETNHVDNM